MKYLITGAAGFIGFHLSKFLLKTDCEVLGLDNMNNYYDIALKQNRLELLEANKNFCFKNIDIANRNDLKKIFKNFLPNKVINLAAQAGVRYSIENPYTYVESNIVGFLNIIELCRNNDVEGLIYASSSSVYGGNKKIPFDIDDRVDKPISLYAATKRSNELIAHSYSHLYGLNTTGLRFFTVYGPWGRPDMAMYIFTKNILEGKPIHVYNNGQMKRDFTYIDDIVSGTNAAIKNNYQCEVFNLGNNRSEELMDIIELIEKRLNKKAIIEYFPMQLGDVRESFANIEKSEKLLHYKPKTNVEKGLKRFIDWYLNYTNNE